MRSHLFIVRRQGDVEIDFDATGQRLQALHEAGVDGLEALRMVGDVARQEAQELTEHRVVNFGGVDARQHNFAAGA